MYTYIQNNILLINSANSFER